MINKFKKICTKIGISTKPWCGAIVGLWVAFREGGIIKLLIKIFKWLTNKLEPLNRIGIPVRFAVAVVIFIAVYILITVVFVFVIGLEDIEEWVRSGLSGIVALIGLYIAYYRTDAMQKQADTAERDRTDQQFSQSVTLSAKDNQDGTPAIEARVGGIYALAKIAEADSEGYGAQVMKTLVVYIRNNAQRTALPVPSKEDKDKLTTIPEKRSKAAHLGEDVKTAFAELKQLHSNLYVRENSGVNDEDLSFSYADFRALRLNEIEWIEKPDLSDANLLGAHLISANLPRADLRSAKLQGADFRDAVLQDADLMWANLQGADLRWANLQGANLGEAKLQGADFRWANLNQAVMNKVSLDGADFRQTKFHVIDLTDTKAIYTAFEGAEMVSKSYLLEDMIGMKEPWKVWHDDNQFLPNGKTLESLKLDAKWDLALIFSGVTDTSDVVFILEGILRNFADKGDNKSDPRAIECRKAVKQWVIDHNLWEHLSDDWRDWLKTLNDEGYAPDDK